MAPKIKLGLALLVATCTFLSPVHSWGELGHRTVAYLAEMYLTPDAVEWETKLLHNNDEPTKDISDWAIWADEIKRRRPWTFTPPWHFIDAHDSPPARCGVEYKRDCSSKGCVVSAIMNQTGRVNDPSLDSADQADSLRFLLHFIGDIHQPLHTEAEELGGNHIQVEFDGRRTNLHSIWDTNIPEKMRGKHNLQATAKAWATELFQAAQSRLGPNSLAAECQDLNTAEKCALAWATEANAWICKMVLKDDVADQELGGEYFNEAVPIVEELIEKAGRRLGAWINALYAQHVALMKEHGHSQWHLEDHTQEGYDQHDL